MLVYSGRWAESGLAGQFIRAGSTEEVAHNQTRIHYASGKRTLPQHSKRRADSKCHYSDVCVSVSVWQ